MDGAHRFAWSKYQSFLSLPTFSELMIAVSCTPTDDDDDEKKKKKKKKNRRHWRSKQDYTHKKQFCKFCRFWVCFWGIDSQNRFWVVQIPNHFLLNNSENFGFVLWRIEFREISAFCKNSEPLLFCEQFCKFCKCWVCMNCEKQILSSANSELFFVHGQFCKFCKCWTSENKFWVLQILNLSLFVLWAIL